MPPRSAMTRRYRRLPASARLLALLAVLAAIPGARAQTGPTLQPPDPAGAVPAPTSVTSVEVKRTIKAGREAFIGSWLSVGPDCKVGETPKIEVISKPENGELRTRPAALNIRDAPGAPRRGCVGVSPRAIAVAYRPKWRFKGEDKAQFRVTFPDGRVREVSAIIEVQ